MKMKYFIIFFMLALYKFEIRDYIANSKDLLNLPDPNQKAKKREKQTDKEEKAKIKSALKEAIDMNMVPDDYQSFEAYQNMDEKNENLPYLKKKMDKSSVKFKKLFRLIL